MPSAITGDFSLAADRWVYTPGPINARDDAEMKIATQGFQIANAVLLSDCFRQGVLAAPMTHTRDQSQQQIYDAMTGPAVPLSVVLYDGGNRHGTVGYENSGEPGIVHMNRFYVHSAYMVADNLLHEAAHTRGYIHKSSKEAESVPYTMNRIFEACAVNMNTEGAGSLVISDSQEKHD
jgi:hypothetical protein